MKLLKDWNCKNNDLASHCSGHCGFVTEVNQRYGEDSSAPGQAMKFSVAFPFEDAWREIPDIPLSAVRRILNKELALKEEIYENA